VKVNDFFESSHYIVDTLKDEFCTKKEDGWYEVKQPVDQKFFLEKLTSEEGREGESATKPSDDSVMKIVP